MTEHNEIGFAKLHKAKFDAGLAAALPVSPEGVGDAYLQTDTGILSVCLTAGVWTDFSSGGGSAPYVGRKEQMNAAFTVTGGDEGQTINWTQGVWAYSITGTGGNFIYSDAGLYEYHITLLLENSAAGRWHLEVNYDNVFQSDIYEWQCSGDGTPFAISFSGQFKALKDSVSGDNQASFYIYQNSGSNQDILTWSNVVLQFIGPSPA